MKTTSQEISKRLVEAGMEVNGDFGWFDFGEGVELFPVEGIVERYRQGSIPAPTACELGELLPLYTEVRKLQDGWVIECLDGDGYINGVDTMADAMGLMLIWLKENGHLDK
jgi:hypothetical protein